ncbi:hypothetical protein CCHR01_14345 [Colletotrichum chrysophilum]|uniref:Uncharacterized protein n=1 Tax=Colletotrichum chrysophilum TaxID=1836956 RepID=A0AAD9A9U0_9PEZI|nr:hypothetical protein CCHR01_14345 [Colletotrichum chrysophilum]
MDKHIGSLHRLLNHFEDHDEPTSKQKSNFSGAISLFPNGGCRSHDSASTMSKRKSAYKILRKVKDEIGFSMFLLCAFHFSRTALVEMKEPDKFCDELRNVTITEKFQAVATNYEQIHGDTLKDTASAAATGDHNSVVHTKRKFDGTELGGGEPTRQVRRITSEEGESSDKETNGHTSDPLLSDGKTLSENPPRAC